MTTTLHRKFRGTAVSTKMQKTAVIRVDREVEHPKYHKKFVMSRKYKIHDPEGKVKAGDFIEFEECRPLSKDKRWRYVKTLNAAT